MGPHIWPAKAGRPARTYIQQLCDDTGCSPEDLPEAMNDRRSGERGSGISVPAARHDDDDDGRLFSNLIQKSTTLLLADILTVTWVQCMLRHPILLFWFRMELGVVSMKEYFTLPRSLEAVLCLIQDTPSFEVYLIPQRRLQLTYSNPPKQGCSIKKNYYTYEWRTKQKENWKEFWRRCGRRKYKEERKGNNLSQKKKKKKKKNPWGIVGNVLDCDIAESKFELQSRYYVHFWANTFRKSMNHLIL